MDFFPSRFASRLFNERLIRPSFVVVWSGAPSDGFLFTLHPCPQFCLSLTSTDSLPSSMSVQFVKPLEVLFFPPFCQCSISSSPRRSCTLAFRRPLGRLSCRRSDSLFILISCALLCPLAAESAAARVAVCSCSSFLILCLFLWVCFLTKRQGQATMGLFSPAW